MLYYQQLSNARYQVSFKLMFFLKLLPNVYLPLNVKSKRFNFKAKMDWSLYNYNPLEQCLNPSHLVI